jgi:hypothetical protein
VPLQVFVAIVFGICTWMGLATIEPLMRSFAAEAGVASWLFVAVPGLLAMFFAVLAYVDAVNLVTGMLKSLSRALLVGLATWSAVAIFIAWLWCPAHNALRCFSTSLIASGIVGGGPLLIGALVAGGIVGLVIRRRPSWIAFGAPRVIAGDPTPNLDSPTDAR